MKTSEEKSNIQELTQALRELQIAQNRVNEVIERLRASEENRINNTGNQNEEQQQLQNEGAQQNQQVARIPVARVIEDTEAIPGTTLRIGDTVRILNPKRDQADIGIITVYRVTYIYTWIIVNTRTGQSIRRIAKNLRKL